MAHFDMDAAWAGGGARDPVDEEREERKLSLRSRLLSFREMAGAFAPPSEELLGPLVVRGQRTFVSGHTGEGKTTFALSMLRAVMTGEEFLGWKGAGGTVMVIDVEQSVRTVHRRMGEIWLPGLYSPGASLLELMENMPGLDDSWYWRVSEGLALNEEHGVDREVLEEEIATRRPDVVMLDPLYKTFLGNPNEAEVASSVMRLVDRWREEYGFAFVMPVHPRKPPNVGGTFTIHDVSGAGGWVWGAEMVLGIQRRPGRGAILKFFKDRDDDYELQGTSWTLVYSRDDGFRRAAAEAGAQTPTYDLVSQALYDNATNPLTLEQLCQITGRDPKTVRNALQKMKGGSTYPLRDDLPRGAHGAKVYAVDISDDVARWEEMANG